MTTPRPHAHRGRDLLPLAASHAPLTSTHHGWTAGSSRTGAITC
jgi:hypothetical protein